MKSYFLFACLLISSIAFSQSVVPIRGDTIKVYKQGGNATLQVTNKIQNLNMVATDTAHYIVGILDNGVYVKMNASGLGGNQGLQDVIDVDNVLTKIDTIDLRGFELQFRINNSTMPSTNVIRAYSNDSNFVSMGSGLMRLYRSNFPDIGFYGHARYPSNGMALKAGLGYDTTGQGAFGGGGHMYIDMRDSVAVFVFESAGTPDHWFFTKYYANMTGGAILGYSGRGKVMIYGANAPDVTSVGDASLKKFNVFGTSYFSDTIFTEDGALKASSSSTDSVWVRDAATKQTRLRAQSDISASGVNIYNSDGTTTDNVRSVTFLQQLQFNGDNGFAGLTMNETTKSGVLSSATNVGQTKYTWLITRNDFSNSEAYGSIESFTSDTTYTIIKANSWENKIVNKVVNSVDSMLVTQDKDDIKFRHNETNLIEVNTSGIKSFDGILPTSGNTGDSIIRRNSTNGQFYLSPVNVNGTYEPTLTSVTNVTATTSYSTTKYFRVGDMVTVFGKFIVDPTSTGATEMDISLPISSNFTGDDDAAGNASCLTITGEVLTILADATNDRARVMWNATDVSSRTVYFHFSYMIK